MIQGNKRSDNTGIRTGKVRWRQHEGILVSMLLVTWMAGCVGKLMKLDATQLESYLATYTAHQLHFRYYKNILLPQVGAGILFYLVYWGINRGIIHLVKRVSWRADTAVVIRQLVLVAVAFCVLSWLLALGINVATWFAHPWLFNYSGFQVLAWLGYNDRPMDNLWTGFDHALWIVGIFSFLAGLREILIRQVEKPGLRQSYRVLVLNQFTLFGVIYCAVLAVVVTFQGLSPAFASFYFSFLPSTFLVFMINTYWLFPRREGKSLFSYKTLIFLLLFTFTCTFPFFLWGGWELPHPVFVRFVTCWAMQLLVTTPIAWLLYQQRKDKILQLRGAAAALSKSKADLQFLRSQINPHFLFNALNTLYGTALREKAPDTATGIQQLGDMMRFMLHENNLDFIPLKKEIEYLSNYIALQKLRTQASPAIVIEDHIQEQACAHMIAPMMLIPFVENAFKHGISLREPSWIHLSLVCDDQYIRFEVRNSLHQRRLNDPEREQSGIGLPNVLERLKLVYPGRHTVSIHAGEKEFAVLLSIRPDK